MSNEVEVRAQARHALISDKIPRCDPDRTWGGPGADMPCTIRAKRVTVSQMEYELQFRHDGATPDLDRYHLHLRCFSAWEMERTKLEGRR
jgi:hypothetical protein